MNENQNIRGITVTIGGDASGLESALDRLNEKAEKLVSLLKQADSILNHMQGRPDVDTLAHAVSRELQRKVGRLK